MNKHRSQSVRAVCAVLCLAGVAMGDTLTWTGGGGANTNWSNAANWSSDGTHTTPQDGDGVLVNDAAADRLMVQDIASLRLVSLSVNQATGGVAQTLRLSQDLLVDDSAENGELNTTVPTFTASAGSLVLDAGTCNFAWDNTREYFVVGSGVTVELNGGSIGLVDADKCKGTPIRIGPGGKIAGTGDLVGQAVQTSWGFNAFRMDAGGMLEVGDGLLDFPEEAPFSSNSTVHLLGSVVGTTANSELRISTELSLAGGPDTEVRGFKTLDLGVEAGGFGRFGDDPSQVDLSSTLVYMNNAGTAWWDFEALSTVGDLDGFKIGTLKINSGWWSGALGGARLVDTGSVDDDFVYVGTLIDVDGKPDLVDLNGIALLTDMTQTALQAMVDSLFIRNLGPGGAPTVKSVVIDNEEMWYVAPADVEIVAAAEMIPEPVTLVLIGAAVPVLLKRRRQA